MRVDAGVAWGEPFESAIAELSFEGDGLRMRSMDMTKGPGRVTGDAWIGWNNTYVFAAAGEQIPVELLANFKVPQAPLSGRLPFKARGEGNFDDPMYEFDGTVADLYASDEGIGQVHGRITLRGETMTIDQLEAVSNRLQVTGSGRIALNDRSDATLFFRLFETSLDPYLKFFAPEISPYTRAIVGGTVDIRGPLSVPAELTVDARIASEDARLTLFDYQLRNQGDVRLDVRSQHVQFRPARARGTGHAPQSRRHDRRRPPRGASSRSNGSANLAILQAFYPELNAGGGAALDARFEGAVRQRGPDRHRDA